MSSVDDRIVNMQFNNRQFNDGITSSQQSLTGLEKSIQSASSSKGLSGLADSVQTATGRFSAMKIAGVTAVATIASKATSAGLNLVKNLTIDPLVQGFQEYQTNLNSVQTIVSNTGESVKTVNKYMDQLNHYSDQTIYNFSEMAKNIGTFTAAGVKLAPATSAIKGIANLAALSGSNSQQASMAMYQLSQAIAAGRVSLQDWNSVVNAGMGGKQFQEALARTAVAMGKVDASAVKVGDTVKVAGKSFRESIGGGNSWLDSKILVNTLATLDGRFSKVALRLETTKNGLRKYSDAQIDAIIQNRRLSLAQKEGVKFTDAQFKAVTKMSDASFNAATQIKTLPQLFGVVQESIGSIWSTAFRGLLGNFTQSVNLWTKVGGVVQKITNDLNNSIIGFVTTWAKAKVGGRADFIKDLGIAFTSLGKVIQTVKMAFKDVFPPNGAATAISLTKGFTALVNVLTPSESTLKNLRSIFGGIFAVLHIGMTVVQAIAAAFVGFFGAIGGGAGDAGGGILSIAAKIGELLKSADKFLTSGGKMIDLFHNLGAAAGGFVGKGLSMATDLIRGIVSGLNPAEIKSAMVDLANNIIDSIKSALGIHSPAASMVPVGLAIVQGIVNGIVGAIGIVFEGIGKIAGAILTGFGNAFSGMDALDFAALLNSVLTAGLLITMRKAVGAFVDFKKVINQTIGQLQSTLKSFQTSIKAKALKDIAIAVGILTASLVVLTLIDPKKLAIGLGGLAGMMGLLTGTLATLSKVSKTGAGLAGLSASFIAISSAMLILTGAIAILAQLDVKGLAQGVAAIGAVMFIMTKSVTTLAGLGPLAKGAGSTMLLMAIALNAIAGAVALFGNMDPATLAVGMLAVGIAIKQFTIALGTLTAMGPGVAGAGAAIFLIASAMVILSGAVAAFGNMDMETLVKGFVAVAIALKLFTSSLMTLGSNLTGVVAAAGAMVLMATAMDMLIPLIFTLGSMDTGSLIKGLLGMAAVLGLFVLALKIMAPVALEAGTALLIFGAAIALIGVGMAAFGAGFALLAATGTAGIAVMTAAITAFIGLLPAIALQLAAAFVQFFQVLAEAAPKLRESFDVIFANAVGVITDNIPVIGAAASLLIAELLNVVIRAIPQFGNVMITLINTAIRVVRSSIPRLADAGVDLILSFISAISSRVGRLVDAAGTLIVNFIRAIGAQGVRIARAGLETIVSFMTGITNAINDNVGPMRAAGLQMALAIANGLSGGLLSEGIRLVKAAAESIASRLPGWMKKVLGISSPSKVTFEIGKYVSQGLALGIDTYSSTVQRSAGNVAQGAVDKMSIAMQKMSEIVPDDDINPTITPVLDLTKIQKDAPKINSLLTPSPVIAGTSFSQAAEISAAQLKAKEDSTTNGQNGSETGSKTVQFIQNNTSPQALSTLEIHRRTSNQLSQAKRELGIFDDDQPL